MDSSMLQNSENKTDNIQLDFSAPEIMIDKNSFEGTHRQFDCFTSTPSSGNSSDSWQDVDSDCDKEIIGDPNKLSESLVIAMENLQIMSQKKKRKQSYYLKLRKLKSRIHFVSQERNVKKNTENQYSDDSKENFQEISMQMHETIVDKSNNNLLKNDETSAPEVNKQLKTCLKSEMKDVPKNFMENKRSKRPTVTTSLVGHQKIAHRKSVKFVSMAEAILKFQTRTPQRFRRSATTNKIHNKTRVKIVSNQEENSESEKKINETFSYQLKESRKKTKDAQSSTETSQLISRNNETKSLVELSFQERNDRLLQKRKELLERVKNREELDRLSRIKPKRNLKKNICEHYEISNQENVPPEITEDHKKSPTSCKTPANLKNLQPLGLHSEKRVKMRRIFDSKIREKREESESHRKQEEAELEKYERQEKLEMRKKMGIKARPMPVFTTPKFVKIRKPLTIAQSPVWSYKKKNNSNGSDIHKQRV